MLHHDEMDRTSLAYWYPRLVEAGIPVPRTVIVRAPLDLTCLLDGQDPDGNTPEHYEAFLQALRRAISELGGPPVFLRTGHGSAKHQWQETCYVTDPEQLPWHVYRLVEWSTMVDILGLPTAVWAVREILPTEPAFSAFRGRLPICREFRYFVRDGVVEHSQPYWPPAALEGQVHQCPDWRERLAVISHRTPEEDQALMAGSTYVSRALPGYWSVDWLWVPDRGWVCIDMAEGDKSFKW